MDRRAALLLLTAGITGSLGCFTAVRIDDEPRRDYHRWNDREERAYRRYLDDRHERYREFRRLDRREQDEYWEWRHRHPDRDRDRR